MYTEKSRELYHEYLVSNGLYEDHEEDVPEYTKSLRPWYLPPQKPLTEEDKKLDARIRRNLDI